MQQHVTKAWAPKHVMRVENIFWGKMRGVWLLLSNKRSEEKLGTSWWWKKKVDRGKKPGMTSQKPFVAPRWEICLLFSFLNSKMFIEEPCTELPFQARLAETSCHRLLPLLQSQHHLALYCHLFMMMMMLILTIMMMIKKWQETSSGFFLAIYLPSCHDDDTDYGDYDDDKIDGKKHHLALYCSCHLFPCAIWHRGC